MNCTIANQEGSFHRTAKKEFDPFTSVMKSYVHHKIELANSLLLANGKQPIPKEYMSNVFRWNFLKSQLFFTMMTMVRTEMLRRVLFPDFLLIQLVHIQCVSWKNQRRMDHCSIIVFLNVITDRWFCNNIQSSVKYAAWLPRGKTLMIVIV